MARFYASFDNSTIAAMEAATPSKRYNRKPMSSGATLKANLIAARDALSAAVYAQLDAGNRRGDTGLVIPEDGFTRSGGNLSWPNLYTNAGAIWQADPSIRPTAPIMVADSTPKSPVDGGAVSETLYTDAVAALEAILTNVGLRTRPGLNPWRTLASLHLDHATTYIAWDDFTPGEVQGLNGVGVGGASGYAVNIEWLSYQYLMDDHPNAKVKVTASLGGPNNYNFDSGLIVPPGTRSVQWNVNGGAAITPGTYELVCTVWCYDATIPSHVGQFVQQIKNVTVA